MPTYAKRFVVGRKRHMAAKTIQRFVRRRLKRRLPQLGRASKRARLQVGVAQLPKNKSKTRVTGLRAFSLIASRTLYGQSLTDIPFGTAANERERNTVKIRGFKIKAVVRNNNSTLPVTIRMALVAPKNNNTPIVTNLLSGYDGDNGLDFSTARTGIEMTMNSVNPHEFAVLWQRSFKLGPLLENNASSLKDGHPAEKSISTYFKLNRTLLWDSAADAEPASDRCFLIYWSDEPSAISGTAVVPNQVALGYNIVAYFRDT